MPVTISVGLSKKIGLPAYSSVGASCQIEFEAESPVLARDLKGFHQQVHTAYVACCQAVHNELARQQGQLAGASGNGDVPIDPDPEAAPRLGGENGGSTAVNGAAERPPRATKKQMDYLHQLAERNRRLGVRRLERLAQKRFGKPLADLSAADASTLIDALKAVEASNVELPHLLDDGNGQQAVASG